MEEFLDGVVISGSVNAPTSTVGFDFVLPADYERDSVNPDLTGFQVYNEGPDAVFDWAFLERVNKPFKTVRVATTTNITLSGLQTVDGVSLVANDRVLVKDQSDRTANGIYKVANGNWSRTTDADESTELTGMSVWVLNGTLNGGTAWSLYVGDTTVTIGTSNLLFELTQGVGYIESAGTNLANVGRVLGEGRHTTRMDIGWETLRLDDPATVSDTMLGSIYRILIAPVDGETEAAWPSSTLRYRILGATADSGTDVFGNIVRSNVNRNKTSNLLRDSAFWMSKANPSKFAIESLYFDHLTEVTIDSVEVDPLTPGMLMSIYYSSEGDPAASPDEWDNKLWNRVPRTYRLTYKNRFALPQPISARYIKLEFTALPARPYNAGSFKQEVEYRKHPKWVLDYFLADIERKRMDDLVPTSVNVIHDAYALVFSYYMDEQRPLAPGELGKVDDFQRFLERNDLINQVDMETLSRISYLISPIAGPNSSGRSSVLQDALSGLYRVKQDVFIESDLSDVTEQVAAASSAIMTEVSTLNREKLMEELRYPEMFFFVNCRHVYRKVRATFQEQRAYFAGIKNVRFIRDTYADNTSPLVYNEMFTDLTNIEINDFA